jgi:8-oxo-dGTP pyrophosphatase MutT (NUDIX family)
MAHARDANVMAAGIAYIDPGANVLLLKRSPDSDHPGEWCLPGGHIDEGETAEQAARRESSEEIGHFPYGELGQIAQIVSDEGVDFTTFGSDVDKQFEPTLNDEHTDFMWAPVKKLPKSTHPGVKAALTKDCGCDSCKSGRTTDSVTGSGFFADEELGPNQYFTPEDFLICESVPIARTGTQEYADIELPDLEAGKDGLIVVERAPEVVFAPDTLASLIGKPVTIGHPKDFVTPKTWQTLSHGTIHNPRRGEGEQSDLLIADLLITTEYAINEIRNNGLRGISVGYDADYEQIAPGRARQTSIVANHAALVKAPRCGPTCSVQDSQHPSLGDPPMAVKNGAESIKDKLRKLFMTRDSEAFEKALSEEVKDESAGMAENVPAIHIHMPGAEKANASEDTKDDESEADPMAKVAQSLDALTQAVTSINDRVSALESAGSTKDSDEEKKDETKDDDGDAGDESDETNDSDEEEEKKGDEKKSTSDSASFRDEFQDAKARAEILAPGVKLPTYDSKADSKKTADSLCVLRRRALRASLENGNADTVRIITGDADVSKMDCAAAKMAFHAASELVKQKNKSAKTATADAQAVTKDLNQIHRDFWNNCK